MGDMEISPTGVFYYTVHALADGPGVYRVDDLNTGAVTALTTSLPSPVGMLFEPDGDLFVTDSLADAIYRFPAGGGGPIYFGNAGPKFAVCPSVRRTRLRPSLSTTQMSACCGVGSSPADGTTAE